MINGGQGKLILDFDPIPEEEETKCSDDLWEYIEAHEDELEDLEAYARANVQLGAKLAKEKPPAFFIYFCKGLELNSSIPYGI